jgi:hypothetical protein
MADQRLPQMPTPAFSVFSGTQVRRVSQGNYYRGEDVLALMREIAQLRRDVHDLNWALGAPGYEKMHDPEDQALSEAAHAEALQRIEAMGKHKARVDAVMALIGSPEIDNFLRGTHLEAVHQVDRWGTAHDRAKRPADWFWLVGYLAGKALHAATAGDQAKARHHCISTAAALYNWHCAIQGLDVRMCPGRSDVAEIVDAAFPGEGGA